MLYRSDTLMSILFISCALELVQSLSCNWKHHGYLCFFANECGLKESPSTVYIGGGEEVKMGEFLSLAQVMVTNQEGGFVTSCSGVVVTRAHVLTSYHCVYNKEEKKLPSPSRLHVWVGDRENKLLEFNKTGQLPEGWHRVGLLCPHPDIDIDGLYTQSDVVLLRLHIKLNFTANKLLPACWPGALTNFNNKLLTSGDCYQVGFGDVERGSGEKNRWANKLQVIRVTCPIGLADPYGSICFESVGGKGNVCRGDSGGPLLCWDKEIERWIVHSLASFIDRYECSTRDALTYVSVPLDENVQNLITGGPCGIQVIT